MPGYSREIEKAAREAAKIYTIDEGRQEAFREGVRFVIGKLERLAQDNGCYENMMDKNTKAMLAKLSLIDVRQFLDDCAAYAVDS